MKVYTLSGKSVDYENESIESISFHKAREVLDSDDIRGNGLSDNTMVMAISFKDGSVSTFDAENCCIAEL